MAEQNLNKSQDEKQKNLSDNKLFKERRTQIYAYESLGRLLGQVEVLLENIGCKLAIEYHQYVQIQTNDNRMCMVNIQSSLKTLYGFHLYSQNEKLKHFDFPDLPEKIKEWQNIADKLKNTSPQHLLEQQILSHVVNCLIDKKIEILPAHVSNNFIEQLVADEEESGLIYTPTKQLSEQMEFFHRAAADSSFQVTALAQKNGSIQFSPTPMLMTQAMSEYTAKMSQKSNNIGCESGNNDATAQLPLQSLATKQLSALNSDKK